MLWQLDKFNSCSEEGKLGNTGSWENARLSFRSSVSTEKSGLVDAL